MPRRTSPDVGDVTVRRETRDGILGYTLSSHPGVAQCLLRTREAAVEHAVRFARHRQVRVWLAADGGDLVLLDDFRTVESGRTPRIRKGPCR